MKNISLLILSVLLIVLSLVSCVDKNTEDMLSGQESRNEDISDYTVKTYKAYNILTTMCMVKYPTILKITSKAELDEHIATAASFIDNSTGLKFRESWNELEKFKEFIEVVNQYDNEYFENNILVLVLVKSGSGSLRFRFTDLLDSGKIYIEEEYCTFEMPMAYYHIVIEVPKNHPTVKANADFTLEIYRVLIELVIKPAG